MKLRVTPWALAAGLGCGGGPAHPRLPEEVPIGSRTEVADAGAADAGDALPPMAELIARAPQLAPGMQVLTTGDDAAPKTLTLAPVATDLCVRGIFVADAPVRATLLTSAGDALAETDAATSGTFGPRGPVCLRKGQALTLRFEQPAHRVRYVLWAAH